MFEPITTILQNSDFLIPSFLFQLLVGILLYKGASLPIYLLIHPSIHPSIYLSTFSMDLCILFFFINLFIYLFIYGCVGSSFLCEGFLQLWRAGATLHHSAQASHCHGLSLRSTGSRRAGSVVVAHGPSCSAACGIFPDQGSNPCPLHQQADSQPLRHQGSPGLMYSYVIQWYNTLHYSHY